MARLRVHVTPGAREERIAGWHGGSLRVKVRARPEKGRANEAVLRLLDREGESFIRKDQKFDIYEFIEG